jgi:creatinine amidohydrolase
MTWRQAESALSTAQLAILPTGSIEQHGPHMALQTDIAVGEALAQRIADDLGDLAVLCPRIDYGLSEHHMGFPGTLTLRPETFTSVVIDLVSSLAHWGMRRVLVVNGHGGNIDALRMVGRTARRDLGSLVASLMWAQIGSDEIADRVVSDSYGHACEVETSVALVLAPEVVQIDKIEPPQGRKTVDPLADPPRPKVDQTVLMHEWTRDGALGDPTRYDVEDGKAIVEVVTKRAVEFARRFASQPLPDLSGGTR